MVGVFVGLVVLFDTSVDELVAILSAIFGFIPKLFPFGLLSFFKKKPDALNRKTNGYKRNGMK